MRLLALLTIIALLSALALAQNPARKGLRSRSQQAQASSSSRTRQTARSSDEYRPSSPDEQDQTPRRRPAQANVPAAASNNADTGYDSDVIIVETNFVAPGPPRRAPANSQPPPPYAPAQQPPSAPVAPRPRAPAQPIPPASAPRRPAVPGQPAPRVASRNTSRAPSQAGSHASENSSRPASAVVNPLDLDDPIYRSPSPDSPERVGRRYLLLNRPPPTLEFYARTDPNSNNTDIDTIDRVLDRTLHPRFIFNQAERSRIFDDTFQDVLRSLRRLELSTNAHFVVTMGLPDDSTPDTRRLSRVITSRVIDASERYRAIAQRIAADFRRKIAETRRSEHISMLDQARLEEGERIAREELRVLVNEQAQRDLREAVEAVQAAEQDARAAADAAVPATGSGTTAQRASKREHPSPAKPKKPSKKRKNLDQSSVSDADPGADKKSSSKNKGKGKATEADAGVSLEAPLPEAAAEGSRVPGQPEDSITRSHVRSDSVVPSSEPDEEDAEYSDDPELRRALDASLETLEVDNARRNNQPVASSSSTQLEVESGPQNALTPQDRMPHFHRPDPILPENAVVFLTHLGIQRIFWPAIEVVWSTAPRANYAEALSTVSRNCKFYISAADIYSLAALLARSPYPGPTS